ncbi:DUF421 domain-containing protein [Peribacillus sp. NPDC097675]|uniref:DUF421 domain-containing protein n=1 Tax=Peribacillus sp. NPDC097675 TaxID=3390618 RepID=UPI003D03DF4B
MTEIIIRSTLSFLVLLSLTRIMERKEISEMTFFNFASAISIGSIAGNLSFNHRLSILNGIIALMVWSLLTLLSGRVVIKSKRARKLMNGEPLIIIKNGKMVDKSLRKVNLDSDTLMALLRQKNIFSITESEYAIFEITGKLSVMKKDNKQPVTREDMNIVSTQKKLPPIITGVVSDGVINKNNLDMLNLDTDWLNEQLLKARISTISAVFYAEVQPDHTLHIDSKNDHPHGR